ncbi:primosomal protein N' [Secundilactobacillus collinoides]|uniref:Replication restart protein PriA n=2 Tax=Secundilactobacillus collinoides TaxID=33960 RepID=A0A0R2BET0_SECCO|nr:primosomal protein N' [Secundilactobacillus collinoides]KRM77360.1 primosomal protein N [Secundilactobacillus collinoides DSM 20515 = JCM 1123]KZL40472.1 primosomal protein DnaI [Secundilactobacillus collinoides]
MPEVAEVIVDVPTMQTNTPYSYLIPATLTTPLLPGMRVIVPFGNGSRKVQGFVWRVHELVSTEHELKTIDSVMDLSPVLNQELMAMAEWLASTTYAFTISVLLTMLPNALKAAYEKWATPGEQLSTATRQRLFGDQSRLELTDKLPTAQFNELMSLYRKHAINVTYEVKSKGHAKLVTMVKPALPKADLEAAKSKLRVTAVKQADLLDHLMVQTEPVSQPALEKQLGVTSAVIKGAADKGWLTRYQTEVYRDPLSNAVVKTQPLKLNDAQQTAVAAICRATDEQQETTFLLEGVTGSGKTEVYLQAIANALEQGKNALMLVPEISLTPQIVGRVRGRFGKAVAVLHSGLSAGERFDEWRRIDRGEARVVVGARSAVFAPLTNIGVIIMDEEHEASYKQDDNPRYHARDVALWRSRYHHCPVVLGSATPSLESRARAQKNRYQRLLLPTRVNEQALPKVTIVDMTQELQQHAESTFSTPLMTAINDRLARGEQSLLMLNRRGFSSFVMCRDCGFVLKCPNCDISLTLHMDTHSMKCHYCGHEEPIPQVCPNCHSRHIRYYGTGTQKVEAELKQLLPNARILRMDVDTTRRKGAHERLLRQFGNHEADILLGTQMIAKGLDFPDVTLVGVLNADTALGMPDFRSSERTFQLLTQVSGRAGRAQKPGQVFIQTYNPDHYAIQLAKSQDYERFFVTEMKLRHQGNYPPYYFAVKLTASDVEERVAATAIHKIAAELQAGLSQHAIILGPTPSAIARVNKRYYYQLVIKYKQEPQLSALLFKLLNQAQKARKGLQIAIDNNPMSFM